MPFPDSQKFEEISNRDRSSSNQRDSRASAITSGFRPARACRYPATHPYCYSFYRTNHRHRIRRCTELQTKASRRERAELLAYECVLIYRAIQSFLGRDIIICGSSAGN